MLTILSTLRARLANNGSALSLLLMVAYVRLTRLALL